MANVSQKISSYVHGISQQPDHLKKPGQVRHLLNGLPDVTEGLKKRAGSELIADLNTSSDGKWFTIFRDANEKYIAQVSSGGLRVWSLIDGQPRVVRYNSTPDLEKPEDGGVGIKPPFEDSEDGTPPSSGGGTGIPGTCDMPAYIKATQAVVDAAAAQAAADLNYKNYLNHYNHLAANLQTIVLHSTAQQNGTGGIWFNCGTTPSAPAGYAVGPYRHRREYYLTSGKYTIKVCNEGYDLMRVAGTYTQSQVDAAAVAMGAAYAQLQIADAKLAVEKQNLQVQENKCKLTARSKAAQTFTRNTPIPYLTGTTEHDIETLTLNDYTFIVNKKVTISMGKDASTKRPYEAFVEVKNIEYNSEYTLTITKPGAAANVVKTYAKALSISPADWTDEDGNSIYTDTQTYTRNDGGKINLRYTIENRGQPIPDGQYDYDARYQTYVTLVNGGEGWVTGDTWVQSMKGKDYTIRVTQMGTKYAYDTTVPITPFLTAKDQATGTIKPLDILSHFQKEIQKVAGWSAQIIGNGIYITGPEEFSIYASGGKSDAAMDVMTNKVNNIAKLPIQCKDGYVVKILNTGEQEDDYYVKFIGTKEGIDGVGAWEETIAPGIVINLNETTMPHQLVRMPDGSFMVSPVDWENRLVGDKTTNPVPSFVGKSINKMFFYRNRLGFLSDENIILSRAGDYFNFFAKTALTVSESDPIDLATSSTTPSVLHDAVPLNTGLVLFSRERQFMLSTSNDSLTPIAVKLEVLSTYNCSEVLPAFEMGTTVGFLAKAGKYSAMWEMTNINSNSIPEVIEQSKIVQELLPVGITDIANNKDNSLIVFGVRDSSDVYLYRYFNDGERRIQSAWFQWSCAGGLIHHAVDEDVYYQVTYKANKVHLTKTAIRPNSSEQMVVSDVTYSPRMDMRTTVPQGSITYDRATRTSSFLVSHEYTTAALVFGMGYGRFQGRVGHVKSVVAQGTQWLITVDGNWKDNYLSIGYLYEMKVDLPYTYFSQSSGERTVTDTRAYTNVHRMKFELSKVGYITIAVDKKGKDTFISKYEQSPANDYQADTHEVDDSVIHTVPIYEKNTNALVTITSKHPTPCTLLSSMWEGAVSTKSYKSV